jgi:hypothetical protein
MQSDWDGGQRFGGAVRRSEYLATPKGQLSLLRRRRASRFHCSVYQEPKSKTAISLSEKQEFQRVIVSELSELRRRAYRSPVVVEIGFSVSQRNPPAIHTLAKNYLDLLREPVQGSHIGRRRILYEDDRLIRVLTARYRYVGHASSSEVRIEADTLVNLIEDLKLLQRIEQGQFDQDQHGRTPRVCASYDGDDSDDDSDLEWRRELTQERDRIVGAVGTRMYKAMMDMAVFYAQRRILRTAIVRPSIWATLLSSWPENGRDAASMELTESILSQQRGLVVSSPFAISLGHAPIRDGETTAFKIAVRKVLEDFKRKYPLLFPLRVPLGVTVLYVPPRTQGIDLDNLARYVVPFVAEIIQPPSMLPTWQDVERIPDSRLREGLQKRLEYHVHAPRYSITHYQAVGLPRLGGDPDEGWVRLAFEDGMATESIYEQTNGLIAVWEDSVG